MHLSVLKKHPSVIFKRIKRYQWHPQFLLTCPLQKVGYFHSYIDGVDFVFVDHPSFNQRGNDIYGGGRLELMFRCALLSKVSGQALISKACRIGQVGLGKGLVDKDCEISIRLVLLKKAWTALRPSSADQRWTIGLVARFVTWL